MMMKPSTTPCPEFGHMETDEILSTIAAMCHQESTAYKGRDYLYQEQPTGVISASQQTKNAVDEICREKMAQWCFQMIDYVNFSRETVSIAMSYLDRYMMTPAGLKARQDRSVYQLAAMTCLYTAVKIYEPEVMDPALVSGLSRGTYSETDITDMEKDILQALQWRVQPPIAMSFCRLFMTLLPNNTMTETERKRVMEMARFQTELAVNEYCLMTVDPSTIAFAAIQNTLEGQVVTQPLFNFLQQLVNSAAIDVKKAEAVQQRLMDALLESCGNTFIPSTAKMERCGSEKTTMHSVSSGTDSPRTVATASQ